MHLALWLLPGFEQARSAVGFVTAQHTEPYDSVPDTVRPKTHTPADLEQNFPESIHPISLDNCESAHTCCQILLSHPSVWYDIDTQNTIVGAIDIEWLNPTAISYRCHVAASFPYRSGFRTSISKQLVMACSYNELIVPAMFDVYGRDSSPGVFYDAMCRSHTGERHQNLYIQGACTELIVEVEDLEIDQLYLGIIAWVTLPEPLMLPEAQHATRYVSIIFDGPPRREWTNQLHDFLYVPLDQLTKGLWRGCAKMDPKLGPGELHLAILKKE